MVRNLLVSILATIAIITPPSDLGPFWYLSSYAPVLYAQATTRLAASDDLTAVERLVVGVDTGKPGSCEGAALIVGYDQTRAYAVITQELSARLLDATPRPTLNLSMRGRAATMAATRQNGSGAALRAATKVLHESQSSRIAVLEMTDPAMLAEIKTNLRFDLLGPAATLVRRDPLSLVPCPGVRERPGPRPLLGLIRATDSFVFAGDDLATLGDSFINGSVGGPAVHVLGTHPTIVGITSAVGERTSALNIDAILAGLRTWKVPVLLTPPGTRLGCTYSFTLKRPPTARNVISLDRGVMLASSGVDTVHINVDTGGDCSWTAYSDGSSWYRIADAMRDAKVQRTGPGYVAVSPTRGNMCDGRMRAGAAMVAGHLIRIEQDGTALSQGCQAEKTSR